MTVQRLSQNSAAILAATLKPLVCSHRQATTSSTPLCSTFSMRSFPVFAPAQGLGAAFRMSDISDILLHFLSFFTFSFFVHTQTRGKTVAAHRQSERLQQKGRLIDDVSIT